MRILTGGCSFTAHTVRNHLAWPYHLQKIGYEVTNTAEMASGNGIILERLMYKLDDSYDYCIVMWSSPYRVEFLLNNEVGNYSNIIYKLRKTHALSNYVLTDVPHNIHPESNWLRVGGGYGSWKFDVPEVDNLLKNYFKWVHNLEYQFIQTLKSIVLLQNYCDSIGVKLINTCWNNVFDFITSIDDRSTGSNRYVNMNMIDNLKNGNLVQYPIIGWYPNAEHWYNKIDWSKWFFYETDYLKRGGLGEFALIESKDEYVEGGHPSTLAQMEWAYHLAENVIK